MPYIAIKALPRDEEKKRLLAERINEVMMEVWGCPQRAITISIQDIAPDEWDERCKSPILTLIPKSCSLSPGKRPTKNSP